MSGNVKKIIFFYVRYDHINALFIVLERRKYEYSLQFLKSCLKCDDAMTALSNEACVDGDVWFRNVSLDNALHLLATNVFAALQKRYIIHGLREHPLQRSTQTVPVACLEHAGPI